MSLMSKQYFWGRHDTHNPPTGFASDTTTTAQSNMYMYMYMAYYDIIQIKTIVMVK